MNRLQARARKSRQQYKSANLKEEVRYVQNGEECCLWPVVEIKTSF